MGQRLFVSTTAKRQISKREIVRLKKKIQWPKKWLISKTKITKLQEAKITALACSEAPNGRSKWTLRLLADKIVELGYLESISHNQVGVILKKMNSNHI